MAVHSPVVLAVCSWLAGGLSSIGFFFCDAFPSRVPFLSLPPLIYPSIVSRAATGRPRSTSVSSRRWRFTALRTMSRSLRLSAPVTPSRCGRTTKSTRRSWSGRRPSSDATGRPRPTPRRLRPCLPPPRRRLQGPLSPPRGRLLTRRLGLGHHLGSTQTRVAEPSALPGAAWTSAGLAGVQRRPTRRRSRRPRRPWQRRAWVAPPRCHQSLLYPVQTVATLFWTVGRCWTSRALGVAGVPPPLAPSTHTLWRALESSSWRQSRLTDRPARATTAAARTSL